MANKVRKKKTYSKSPIRPVEKKDRIVSNTVWLKGRTNIRRSWDIKLGDTVIVLNGDDKGKVGKVQKVIPSEAKILVEGINIITKHIKSSPGKEEGEIVKKEAPIWIWKVALAVKDARNPEKFIGTRIRKRKNKEGKTERIAVKTGEVIE